MTFPSPAVTALRLLLPLLCLLAAAGRSTDRELRTGPGLTRPPPPAIVSEPSGTGPAARDPVTAGGRGSRRRSTDTQPSVFAAEKNPQTVSNEAWSSESREVSCNCSSGAEGILDPDQCNQTSGQCLCLSGYTGLQCEDCEEGHFTNGTSGCQPCACDSFGAVNHLCDSSGICVCKTGVYGPKCDECHPGFFRFSSSGCQLCECHNHTAYCHPQSGVCLNCVANTQGSNCEECKPGFYRSPTAALTEACAPCPCSNSTSTGTCHFDLQGSLVCDQCLLQYGGPQCDRCSAGFFKASGACVPCDCSGNADPQGPSQLCDPDTGRCLRCLNSTAGLRCQLCASGFIGDARLRNCTQPPGHMALLLDTRPVCPGTTIFIFDVDVPDGTESKPDSANTGWRSHTSVL
ncbi:multiple epidermal growth factor-like domains protein 9 isoform X2 [Thalassophryne amazonica]|uniref:multiple epidermal growth factor-like domains protein 9 isoform X2 n=1 Tax=Thalassophryne amazonica TaxID=390379 RepID=UPI00147267A1|nr:multiple epidermal growth factor-like domains protein 9 isoform X2 [Thalassophryne amazonica]